MIDEDREKIIEKALKLRELSNRGVGGEKDNATRFLKDYKEKHNITDEELNLFRPIGDTWYDSIPKEERTAPFAKWFRRSVAVEPNGNRMVFYHKSRTTEPFFEFNQDMGLKYADGENCGFHFVHNEDSRYVRHIGDDHNGSGYEFKVYLRMANPYYIYSRLDGNSYGQEGEQYRPIKINKEVAYRVQFLGYDSIIIQDEYGINVYVVFTPNQIKSIDNNGDFSDDNNNIMC